MDKNDYDTKWKPIVEEILRGLRNIAIRDAVRQIDSRIKTFGLFATLELLKGDVDLDVDTVEKRCWLPKFCIVSGKFLFLKKAVCVKVTEYLDDIFIDSHLKFWVDSKIYTLELLKS